MNEGKRKMWGFGNNVSEERQDELLKERTFEEVIELVKGSMKINKGIIEPANNAPKLDPKIYGETDKYQRAEYTIEVSETAFDVFFNSPYGYRGEYYQSTGAGLQANRDIIDSLMPELKKEKVRDKDGRGGYEKLAQASLRCSSAKIWAEEGCTNNSCGLSNDIANCDWQKIAKSCDAPYQAVWGTNAYWHDKLEVKGAFFHCELGEWISHDKVHRHQQIHDWGFS